MAFSSALPRSTSPSIRFGARGLTRSPMTMWTLGSSAQLQPVPASSGTATHWSCPALLLTLFSPTLPRPSMHTRTRSWPHLRRYYQAPPRPKPALTAIAHLPPSSCGLFSSTTSTILLSLHRLLSVDTGWTVQVTQPRLLWSSLVAVVYGWWCGADDTNAAATVVVWHPLWPRRRHDDVADATPASTTSSTATVSYLSSNLCIAVTMNWWLWACG
jgi:hypothetical protein